MGESLQCQVCAKAATVHLTQIINNQIHKVHLCEECAQEKGVTDPSGFSLEDLFAGSGLIAGDTSGAEESVKCSQCGFSPSDFKRLGRLGCPSCYEQMKSFLAPMLLEMHRGDEHKGKIPQRSLTRVEKNRQIHELEQNLNEAVKEERFEDAAQIRDELKQLREASVDATEALS